MAAATALSSLWLVPAPPDAAAQVIVREPPPEHVDFRLDFGRLTLEPLVLLQFQAAPYVGDDAFFQAGDAAESEGFRMRRARLGFRGRLYDHVSFALTTELVANEDGGARILDAAIGYHHLEWLQLVVGAHVVPHNRSQLEGSANIALIERGFTVQALSPGRAVGIQLYGNLWDGALEYHVGVYNGFQRASDPFAGYRDNPAVFGNRFEEVAYAARVVTSPLGPMAPNIQDLYDSDFRFAVGGGYFYSDGAAKKTHGAAADLLVHFRGAHLLAEFLWQQGEPGIRPSVESTVFDTVTSYGVLVEAGYTVLQRIGVHGRFEWYDLNTAVEDETAGLSVAGGVSYHFIDNALKAQVDYIHRQERFGQRIDNNLVLFQLALNLGGLP